MNYLNPEYKLLECIEMNEKINRIFGGVIQSGRSARKTLTRLQPMSRQCSPFTSVVPSVPVLLAGRSSLAGEQGKGREYYSGIRESSIVELCNRLYRLLILSKIEKFQLADVFQNRCSQVFAIFIVKHLCWSLFLIRLQAFIKKRVQHRCFPGNTTKLLRTAFFIEHLCGLF